MKIFKSFFSAIILFLFSFEYALAQTADNDFVELMRADGKIFVVYFLLGVILLGIIVYLIILERKVAHLEKKINSGE